MLTGQQFIDIAMKNQDYRIARAKTIKYNVDMSIYNCNPRILKLLIVLDEHSKEFKELLTQMEYATKTESDIEDIISNKEKNKNEESSLNNFFNAFENDNTKERLFVVIGETGVGKSYLIEERYPTITSYACNKGLDPYSLCYYLADEGNGLTPHETPFLKALKNGGKVFLDEMNELPHDTLMFIQGITDEKKSVVIGKETVNIHKNFKIIAALNPPSETDERMPLGDAILGRAVGLVLELTDDIICKRIGKNKEWLKSVRRLYSYIRQSGMIDLRDLNFRDYQRFSKYNFETQLQFKVCMGDVKNIANFNKIRETGEYQTILKDIKNNTCKKEEEMEMPF
jgi:hypothetical protein